MTVIVQAEGDDYFRGLFLQARMTGCNVNETKTIGVFTNTDRELATRHCFGEVHVCTVKLFGRFFFFFFFFLQGSALVAGTMIE